MLARAAVLGVLAGLIVAVLSVFLAGAVRCIDTPEFYDPKVLFWPAVGAASVVAGAFLAGADRSRIALPLLLAGLVLIAYGIVGPPYKSCGQFFVPL